MTNIKKKKKNFPPNINQKIYRNWDRSKLNNTKLEIITESLEVYTFFKVPTLTRDKPVLRR